MAVNLETDWSEPGKLQEKNNLHYTVHGFSYLSEVRAMGPVELGKKAFGPSKLGKSDAVKKK